LPSYVCSTLFPAMMGSRIGVTLRASRSLGDTSAYESTSI
jgi:hypothetical protein